MVKVLNKGSHPGHISLVNANTSWFDDVRSLSTIYLLQVEYILLLNKADLLAANVSP